jgi:hypothetical protein
MTFGDNDLAMTPDSVHFGALSREARAGIRLFVERRGGNVDRVEYAWLEFDEVCAMWFLLRRAEDDPEIFPKGKSATLQAIEGIIERAIVG